MAEEMITISKKELESKSKNLAKISFGTGLIATGSFLLFDKKVDRTTSLAIMGAGAFIIGLSVLFRWIDKIPDKLVVKE